MGTPNITDIIRQIVREEIKAITHTEEKKPEEKLVEHFLSTSNLAGYNFTQEQANEIIDAVNNRVRTEKPSPPNGNEEEEKPEEKNKPGVREANKAEISLSNLFWYAEKLGYQLVKTDTLSELIRSSPTNGNEKEANVTALLCAIFDSEGKEAYKDFTIGAFRQIIRLVHSHNPSTCSSCNKEKR